MFNNNLRDNIFTQMDDWYKEQAARGVGYDKINFDRYMDRKNLEEYTVQAIDTTTDSIHISCCLGKATR